MNYDELNPGTKLDKLVAEQVMGWVIDIWPSPYGTIRKKDVYKGDEYYIAPNGNTYVDPLDFSTDIASAWKVVEKSPYYVYVWVKAASYVCTLRRVNEERTFIKAESYISAPHAICIAALKAMEEQW